MRLQSARGGASTARAHFFRRLVGERDGEHFGRLGVAIAHEVRERLVITRVLPETRACEDEEAAPRFGGPLRAAPG